jgi:hypothetical protein
MLSQLESRVLRIVEYLEGERENAGNEDINKGR